ncbi:MAG: cyclic nucleotide-binding domain-containing protein [Chitinophagaceae bacterium]|jgi:CRP-like cAMP-binding protein|nr:cyclic nucleotide-binding domain-containing protein [Chitinophagaceae bacterium]
MQIETAIEHLKEFIFPIHLLSNDEWNDFASIWQIQEAKRKTILTAASETEKYLYFIVEGVQRAFYVGENNQEATIVFTYPFSFSGVADSFLTQTPSLYHFETLTKSTYLKTSYQQIAQLMNKYHNFERVIRIATSYSLKGVLERQIELQCFSAEERFKALLHRSPHVLRLIPHKYLASYLGMDATNFSKLLGSVRI